MTTTPDQHRNPVRITFSRRDIIAGAAGAAALGASGLLLPAGATAQDAVPDTGLPQGTVLVTSNRLPLPGITSANVQPLVQGAIGNWREAGAPVSLAVTPFAIDGLVPDGMTPTKIVNDYAGLVAELDATPGGFAAVPLDTVDFQVRTLLIDDVDPLRSAGTENAPIVRIGAAGDIIPGRNVANYIRKYNDYAMPLQRVKSVLADFDFTFANFECFISETIEPPELTEPNALDFVTQPPFVPTMIDAGIDAVSMANNHAVFSGAGWGLPAFYDSYKYLTEGGMPVFGAGRDIDEARAPFVTEVNGVSIAIIGIDGITANMDYPDEPDTVEYAHSEATVDHGGTNPLHMETITADISNLASQYDIVIPFYHMGNQYMWTSGQWCYDIAHMSIDAGASMVVSSHPHTIQGMETYKGKPIFYAIGNFIYDQQFSVDTSQGYVLDLTLRGNDVIGFRTHPVQIEDFSQPRFLGPGEQAAFMDRFWTSVDLREATMK
ncbi:MAG TPA: CapA family protein [Thermomicrobiales bacterium]|nr:CapA family protein [Thermomicrobiales bacterium]